MKIGIFSDAHGNIEALKKAYSFFANENVDDVYFIGDAVGYLPYGLEVIDFLMENKIKCIKGNHEAMLLGELPIKIENKSIYCLDKIASKISSQQISFISAWPHYYELFYNNAKTLLVHGSPTNFLNGYVYPDTDLKTFVNTSYDKIVMGHTHRPFIKKQEDKIFINTGSVGLPRDVGNLSSVLIMDLKNSTQNIYRFLFNETGFIKNNEVHQLTKDCLIRNEQNHFGKIIII